MPSGILSASTPLQPSTINRALLSLSYEAVRIFEVTSSQSLMTKLVRRQQPKRIFLTVASVKAGQLIFCRSSNHTSFERRRSISSGVREKQAMSRLFKRRNCLQMQCKNLSREVEVAQEKSARRGQWIHHPSGEANRIKNGKAPAIMYRDPNTLIHHVSSLPILPTNIDPGNSPTVRNLRQLIIRQQG